MHRRTILLRSLLAAGLIAALAHAGCRESRSAAEVAVGNSYLECAVREFLGEDAAVLRLAPPGMCPGHYDVKPSQISALRRCRLLVRFDFEEALENRLGFLKDSGTRFASVVVGEGLCVPARYVEACRQVAEALVGAGLTDRAAARRMLGRIERRAERLDREAKARVAESGLAGAAVLASVRQAAFCRYLGLDVAGTFSAGDSTRISQIADCLRQARSRPRGVRCVIGNQQEGASAPAGLAEHLHVPTVMFSNFPAMGDGQRSFDALLRANLQALVGTR